MPILGPRNVFPKVTKPTNSGMFSGGASGKQKLDPVKQTPITKKTVTEAYRSNVKVGTR